MCIAGPSMQAPQQTPAPTMLAADQLQLGTTAIQQRQAGLLGRLALTANNPQRNQPSQKAQPSATAGQPSASNAVGNQTAAGTLGLPSSYAGPSSSPIYGAGVPRSYSNPLA